MKSVGKSVNFVTNSSICLVTHSITKSGKGKTLSILNSITSSKFQEAISRKSISSDAVISSSPPPSRVMSALLLNPTCPLELLFFATVENTSSNLSSKLWDAVHVSL